MKNAHAKAATVRVLMESEVARQIRQHARSSPKAEVCGVLIGGEGGNTAIVQACIAGQNAAQGGAHVTFTQDTWEHIYQIKDKNYPDARIVGWYHSHPGFGVFLSDHDLFIHQNFFSSPQQIAWVYDPHSDEEGCFGWRDQKIQKIDDVSFRYDLPVGETRPATGGESLLPAVRTRGDSSQEGERDWMSIARDVAVYVVFLILGAAAAFFYINARANLIPKGEGTALILVEDDKLMQVPTELAIPMLDTMKRILESHAPAGAAPSPAALPPAAPAVPKGNDDGRKK